MLRVMLFACASLLACQPITKQAPVALASPFLRNCLCALDGVIHGLELSMTVSLVYAGPGSHPRLKCVWREAPTKA